MAQIFGSAIDVEHHRLRGGAPEEAIRQLVHDFGMNHAPLQSFPAKGSGHKAGLNFGDCFAYALAKHTGEPLLFKGNDFGHTDITPALPTSLTRTAAKP